MLNAITLTGRIIRYNLKIIFAGRFFWFVLAALAFYIFFMIISVVENLDLGIGVLYNQTFLPGILLIFYPTVFGIQRDEDARMLETLFGIPDYRYKVWLVRILLIFVLVFLLLIAFAGLGAYLLYPIDPIALAAQLLFPICFLGALAFLVSTWVKNGNATAVVMVLIGFTLTIFGDILEDTYWNVFLNPFDTPRDFSELAWQQVVWKNRVFLSVGTVVFILAALINLQKRERFI